MSQVDDWADGYADSARDVNLYGPASANVPRSSVVSHQVRYRAPDTSDIPLAPGQNPEGSVYSNASGARMGQLKSRSGYNPPAGGGWDVNSSDTNLRFPNESGGRRYARPKRTKSRSRGNAPANGVKTRSAPLSGSDVTADVLRSVKAAGNTSFTNWRQSLVNQGWSQAEADAVRYDPSTGKFMSNASGQAVTDHYMREQADKDAGIMADNPEVEGKVSEQTPAGQTPAGQTPAKTDTQTSAPVPGRSFIVTENTGDNYVPDFSKALSKADSSAAPATDDPYLTEILAKVPPEVRANMLRDIKQRKARSFARNLFADIPWWAVVGPAGSPAGAIAAGTGRAAEAAAEGYRLYSQAYGNVVERLLAPKGPLTGGARTTLTSADEGLPVGYSLLRNPKIDTSPLAGQTSSLIEQLRAAGIPEDQIAASIARINAGAAGREAAAGGQAAGREAAAGGQAAGREAAAGEQAAGAGRAGEAAADGGVSELANAGSAGREAAAGGQTAGRVERVPSADISMATNENIYSAIDRLMADYPGGASAVQDAIEFVTGKAPEIEHVAESLRGLPRGQLERVFMNLKSIGTAK